jgi:hypothetical protein
MNDLKPHTDAEVRERAVDAATAVFERTLKLYAPNRVFVVEALSAALPVLREQWEHERASRQAEPDVDTPPMYAVSDLEQRVRSIVRPANRMGFVEDEMVRGIMALLAELRAEVAEEIAQAIEKFDGASDVGLAYSHAAGIARLLQVPDCGDQYHGADGGACAGCGFDGARVGQESRAVTAPTPDDITAIAEAIFRYDASVALTTWHSPTKHHRAEADAAIAALLARGWRPAAEVLREAADRVVGTVEVQWAARWLDADGRELDSQDCRDVPGREAAEQRARRLAAHLPAGVTRGEVLRREIHTGPWLAVSDDAEEAP